MSNRWPQLQEPVLNKWYCNDNLDAEHKACSVPQELSDAVINVELNKIRAAIKDVAAQVE